MTMRRLIMIMLAVLVCLPSVQARKKVAKAGKIKDGVFTDATFGFKMDIADNWSAKVKKKDDSYRLVLIQKNYQIPPDYLDAEDYTLVPRMTLFVGESNWSPFQYMDSLLSETYNSDQKKDIFKEFEILNENAVSDGGRREKLEPRGRTTMSVDEKKGVVWEGKVKYVKNVTTSSSSAGGKRVYGAYRGGVVVIKNGDKVMLFHVMTEDIFFESVWAQAINMIMSLKWPA